MRDLREQHGRVLAAEDGVAQLGREAPQGRRAHQEVPGLRRQRGENLVSQVVGDVSIAPREGPHTLVLVVDGRAATALRGSTLQANPPFAR